MNKKAALYIRVSTNYQIDKDSLPFQRKELINYAKYALNIDDYVIFEDAGYSGKDVKRPGYQDMMKRVREGEFTHILVWKIDRVSRNLLDFTSMYEEIKDYNVTFVSKNEQFDTSSAMGEAMLKIILIFAELERKLTAERVKSIMLSRAEKGLWNGANMPLGYKWSHEEQYPIIDELETPTVKYIYDTYEKTHSTGEVKHQLEVRGLKTKRGGNWTSKTISDILRNPFYIGTYRYNYRESARGKIKPQDEWIVVEDNHPAIIDKLQYKKVNSIMDSNIEGRGKSRSKHTHVFRLLINCSKCNKHYISSAGKPRADGNRPSIYKCFNYVHSKKEHRICKGYISEIKLGPFIINYIANIVKVNKYINENSNKINKKKLEKMLLKGEIFKNIAGIYEDDLEHTYNILLDNTSDILFKEIKKRDNVKENKEVEIMKSEVTKLERALNRLEDLYLFADDSMTEKDYLIKKRKLSKRVEELNAKMDKINKENFRTLPGNDLNFIRKASQYLIANELLTNKNIDYNKIVKIMDKELLHELMKSVIKSINMYEDKKVESIEFVNGLVHRFVYK